MTAARQTLMTTKELAEMLGVARSVITDWATRNELPATRVGNMWIFDSTAEKAAILLRDRTGVAGARRNDIFKPVVGAERVPADLLDLDAAGELVGVSGMTVRRYVVAGRLHGWRQRGRSCVSRAEVLSVLGTEKKAS